MTRAPAPQPIRRMRGFEAASTLLGERIRIAGEKRGFAVARLLTHWAEIAGAELSAVTRPVKVGYSRDGFGATLTLLTTSAQAPMVQMQLPRLKDRVNACYGYAAISRISLTQTAPTGFAEGQAEFTFLPDAAPHAEDPAIGIEAKSSTADVRDDSLRLALETLTRNYLSRKKT
ncbi:MAG: DUF721 domain-containing protein [Cereibacter sphaeroides]|uniref:DUF721 domain-containing protein n=1 Tax=Cereibacter sphaeroides TaxID=1063 RepID=A0A2W5S011_CERSP|nr:MAG: DUF721 domain-containing protein [Cereibacter sphaeroides]